MKDPVVLLWGLSGDDPFDAVYAGLIEAGVRVLLVDQRNLDRVKIEAKDGDPACGVLSISGEFVPLENITAAYLRVYDVRRLPGMERAGPDSGKWRHALMAEDALRSWCEWSDALVVNRPSAMGSNNSKPFQSLAIARHFRVPATLVANDRAAVEEFWDRHGEVIYKSTSGVRSIVRRLAPGDRDRLDTLAWCPTQFQEHVPGTDYRVHVVGGRTFAACIETAADDYRYARQQGGERRIGPAEIPEEIAGRCVALAVDLGLHLAGIDLRRTPDGEWYCFEANPSPEFTVYASWTGQPIAEAVVRSLLLCAAQ